MSPSEVDACELALRRFCFRFRLSAVLAAAGVPHPYDFQGRFSENASPADAPPARPAKATSGWRLLGFDVGYPLGVPASPLTAKLPWIDYFSRHGFNIFTYKTVRSAEREPLPFPNWVYLQDLDAPLPLDVDESKLVAHGNLSTYLSRLDSYSTANSFGVPSAGRGEWQREVKAIQEALLPGELLIVSVMGNEDLIREDGNLDEFVSDFVRVAQLADEAGAQAIELNLSCPNKLDRSGNMMRPVCETPSITAAIVHAVRAAVRPDIPIVAKLSYLNFDRLATLLALIAEHVQGIAGINTLQVPIVDPATGEPTFQGDDSAGRKVTREAAGVSGVALRYFALDFVQSVNLLRRSNGWTYDILAMGGVMDAHDVRALMAAGADCVQAATAATTNPALPEQLQSPGWMADREAELDQIREVVMTQDGRVREPREVGQRLGLRAEAVGALFAATERPYDLPRFVAELLALRRGVSESNDDVRRARAFNAALMVARRRRLLDGSLRLAEAAQRMSISEDEVRDLIRRGSLIAVGEGDATHIPTWQFTGVPPTIVEGVGALARDFPGPVEALGVWMTTPHPDLRGATPLAALVKGEHEDVLRLSGAIASAGR